MASVYNGITSDQAWESRRRPEGNENSGNVGKAERVVSVLAAGALALVGFRRRRLRPLLFPIAGSLLTRALTGQRTANRASGRNRSRTGRP